ncbi:aminopeptidase N isoform X2 [Pseudomyrmex gracilis]|nr:aminopeptidase N isoform X2 [Pseudomyrmex gracilis]
MSQSREVLAMMDNHAHTTTFGRKRGCIHKRLTRCDAFFLGALFMAGVISTALLVYHFAPCLEEKQVKQCDDFFGRSLLQIGENFSMTSRSAKRLDVRLPRSIVPDSYELWLIPFIWKGNFTFRGEVKILMNVTTDTSNVTLHAVDLKIDEGSTNIGEILAGSNKTKSIGIAEQRNDTEREFHVIKTSSTLKSGKQYVLHLKFIGTLNDYMQGFYRSSYMVGTETRWIASTQFQATDARRAFPCFDEPALKARFQINIARPRNMTSMSNMPRRGEPTAVPGIHTYVWDHYERSVPMSTYLVAFIVSDLDFLTSEDGNLKVWARHDAINQSHYSLNIGPRILRYYEDYFKIKFPLPKMDMVAIPDFAAGAMENWGLITYRETAMLYQEGVSTSSSKQRVATVVAHELAHQWFGNLVTPSWWTDLWLNEGFASYLEHIGMDSVEPEWKVLEQFVVHDLQNVFGADALESSHPISIEVGHPDEISEIFDSISYSKGASIIRMMDHFLTTEVFKQGLTNYLNEKAYQSAEQNDLWHALTKQAHKDKILDPSVNVKQIMDTWTLQTGFPVVTVTRNYNANSVTLTQERFLLHSGGTVVTTSPFEPLWWIPITYTSEKQLNFNNTRPMKWMKAERSITLNDLDVNSSQWVIFNVQETGYYRVNYDRTNWQMIIKQLNKQNFKDISTINRAQLIDDALNFARAGKLDYTIAFDVTSYLAHEIEYLPWKAALNAFNYLNDMLLKKQGYDKFRVYVLKLLDNVYKQVGFVDKMKDPQLKVFTRINVLNWACMFGHEDCVTNAVQQFNNWRRTPNPDLNNPISPNLKGVVYCTAIRVGGQTEWDFAWERYRATNVGSEKDLLLQALGCTREIWLLNRYLDWALTKNSGIRKQDVNRVFASVASNPIGQPLAFDYFRNKWARLKEYFGTSLLIITNIVKSSTRGISTRYEYKDLLEFAKEHVNEFGSARRTIQQALEQAEANVRWIDSNHATIRDWLERNTA